MSPDREIYYVFGGRKRSEYAKRIYTQDCIEGMREHLPDMSVDVIVTSPPYNIDRKSVV